MSARHHGTGSLDKDKCPDTDRASEKDPDKDLDQCKDPDGVLVQDQCGIIFRLDGRSPLARRKR